MRSAELRLMVLAQRLDIAAERASRKPTGGEKHAENSLDNQAIKKLRAAGRPQLRKSGK